MMGKFTYKELLKVEYLFKILIVYKIFDRIYVKKCECPH